LGYPRFTELGTEKELGIKEDIGKRLPSKNTTKRKKTVMRYTDVWNDLTENGLLMIWKIRM
jgi:isoleucyl-tRNA synthetase